jgi:hypothetical protein
MLRLLVRIGDVDPLVDNLPPALDLVRLPHDTGCILAGDGEMEGLTRPQERTAGGSGNGDLL